MYLEDNLETTISYTNILNQKENEALILDSLKENITNQFNFDNLGYNYLEEFDDPPFEIYDWLLTNFNDKYFIIDDLINIYEQVDRIKFLSTTLYSFLFVEMVEILPKLNLTNNFKNELLSYISEGLISLNTIRQELANNIETANNLNNIEKEILKYSTLLSIFDTNFEMFENNYLIGIKDRLNY